MANKVPPVVAPAILSQDQLEQIPEKVLPEVADPSPFQRHGLAECIVDDVPNLSKWRIYKIEEFEEGDDTQFLMIDDTDYRYVFPSSYFRCIDNGPFRVGDDVMIIETEGIVNMKGATVPHDYEGSIRLVREVKDKESQVEYTSGALAWFPNTHLKFQKRRSWLEANPFHKGDSVEVVKENRRDELPVGAVYTVESVSGESIYLKEIGKTAFLHNRFKKHVIKSKFKKRKKKVKMSLSDQIRNIINANCYVKLSPIDILNILREKKIVGEDINLVDITRLTKGMFRW